MTNNLPTIKSLSQKICDFITMPLRLIILPDKTCEKLGLTSLRIERFNNVLQFINGKLLDIGCGDNRLVKIYGSGIGVDTYDWGGGATIIKSAANLPFPDNSFDTVTVIASLNHIPERTKMIAEIGRVLNNDGTVIITMINPFLGFIGHKIWWYSEEKKRKVNEGETYGIWNSEIVRMFGNNGFKLELHKRFVYWLNNLFIFKKAEYL